MKDVSTDNTSFFSLVYDWFTWIRLFFHLVKPLYLGMFRKRGDSYLMAYVSIGELFISMFESDLAYRIKNRITIENYHKDQCYASMNGLIKVVTPAILLLIRSNYPAKEVEDIISFNRSYSESLQRLTLIKNERIKLSK